MAEHPYNEKYYAGSCNKNGVPYDRSVPQWLEFFRSLAGHIALKIAPRTTFEIGCAKGFLVESLRDLGVQAEGIDISEYAISQVRPDIKPFCRVSSAGQFSPSLKHYDLVISIEVIEHLAPEQGRLAIGRMCELSDTVLVSSTSDDFEEPTHINVQPNRYWRDLFAENGFAEDPRFNFKKTIGKDAMLFRRKTGWTGSWLKMQARKPFCAAFYSSIVRRAAAKLRGGACADK
ncbi:MAG: methyltransferase domain-containing protein [Elusimicrobiaceae bacterium]|nr:methyltransferase domain-containing protein [Elusimicrobiaceae bacterium]